MRKLVVVLAALAAILGISVAPSSAGGGGIQCNTYGVYYADSGAQSFALYGTGRSDGSVRQRGTTLLAMQVDKASGTVKWFSKSPFAGQYAEATYEYADRFETVTLKQMKPSGSFSFRADARLLSVNVCGIDPRNPYRSDPNAKG